MPTSSLLAPLLLALCALPAPRPILARHVATFASAAGDSATSSSPPAPSLVTIHERAGLLRSDRLQHASLSFTLAAGAALAGGSRAGSFGFSISLGFAKELYDRRHSRFDPIDLSADAIGAALGALAAAHR
jgi:hypothetical protein